MFLSVPAFQKKMKEIIHFFSADLTTEILNKILKNIRIKFADFCEKENEIENFWRLRTFFLIIASIVFSRITLLHRNS